jgi:hypothetical protein
MSTKGSYVLTQTAPLQSIEPLSSQMEWIGEIYLSDLPPLTNLSGGLIQTYTASRTGTVAIFIRSDVRPNVNVIQWIEIDGVRLPEKTFLQTYIATDNSDASVLTYVPVSIGQVITTHTAVDWYTYGAGYGWVESFIHYI